MFKSDVLANLGICFHLISDEISAASYLAQAKSVNKDSTMLHSSVDAIMTKGFEGFNCILPPNSAILPFENLISSKIDVAKPLKSTPLIEKLKSVPIVIPTRKQSLDATATMSRESIKQFSKMRRGSLPAFAMKQEINPPSTPSKHASFEMYNFVEGYSDQAPRPSPNGKRFGNTTIDTVQEDDETADPMLPSSNGSPMSAVSKTCITNLADFENNLVAKSKNPKTSVTPLSVIADRDDDKILLTPPEKDEIPERMTSRTRDSSRISSVQTHREEEKRSQDPLPSPKSGNETHIYEGPLMIRMYGVWKRCYGIIKPDHLLILESREVCIFSESLTFSVYGSHLCHFD